MTLLHRNLLTRPVVWWRGRPTVPDESRRHPTPDPGDRDPIILDEEACGHSPEPWASFVAVPVFGVHSALGFDGRAIGSLLRTNRKFCAPSPSSVLR